jgi:hypothetical protein
VIRDCYPLEIALPDGKRAEYVQGSRPPRYTVDGEPTAIDVTIPDELAQSGWYWSGSFLYQPWPEPRTEAQGRGPGVAISTGTFGPPGYPCDRQTCFAAAYELERLRVEVAARPAKKVKAGKKTAAVVAEPELVAEQMELAL